MAERELKRFYLALAFWVVAFLAGLALTSAGVLQASAGALTLSFVLGLFAIYVFFRPPSG